MKNFRIPPISTLIGSTLGNYMRVIFRGHFAPKFYLKLFLSTLIAFIAAPFHVWEFFLFRKRLKKFKFEKPPVFVLGHWRSGTTFLHNVLCQDPEAGYLTTYQSVFPNNLGSKLLFKNFMRLNMPDKRPADNVKLNINYPQEDEFALSNMVDDAYYHFFYFPKKYSQYYESGTKCENNNRMLKSYAKLVKKAMINTHGVRAFIKNPVNTARVKFLLKLYPDAKFIYIYRNPVTVFLSNQKFYHQLMPTLWFYEVSDEYIDNLILDIYPRLMSSYQEDKKLIPPENLMEIKFEEFEKDPRAFLKRIYGELLQEDYRRVEPAFEAYLNEQKGYKKNKWEVPRAKVERVQAHWGEFMKQQGYEVPEELILV